MRQRLVVPEAGPPRVVLREIGIGEQAHARNVRTGALEYVTGFDAGTWTSGIVIAVALLAERQEGVGFLIDDIVATDGVGRKDSFQECRCPETAVFRDLTRVCRLAGEVDDAIRRLRRSREAFGRAACRHLVEHRGGQAPMMSERALDFAFSTFPRSFAAVSRHVEGFAMSFPRTTFARQFAAFLNVLTTICRVLAVIAERHAWPSFVSTGGPEGPP
jgi:hypothetical protein